MYRTCPSLQYMTAALSWVVLVLGAEPGHAQEDTTTIFLVVDSQDAELLDALEDASADFRAQLTRTGRYRFAGTREMEAVVSECRDQIGVSAGEDRACQLQAARVSAMDQVVELSAQALGGRTEVSLHVIEADDNEEIFVASELASGDPRTAVDDALPLLATAYDRWMTGAEEVETCYRRPANSEPAIEEVEIGAVLEVLSTVPSTVSVRVDGVDVGLAPGQFFGLDAGLAEVELSADGCETTRLEGALVDGEVVTIEDIRLEFLPGNLVVSANIAGVTVFIDGRESGTIMTEPLEVELPPGESEVVVRREGYRPFTRVVDIAPGGRQTLHAELTTQICGDGVVEGTEVCDDGNDLDGDGCSAACLPEPPRLALDCGVEGAEIWVDGRLEGHTGVDGGASIEVAEGRHQVEVRDPAYQTDSRSLDFEAGRVTTARVALVEWITESGGSSVPWIVLGLGTTAIVGGAVVDIAHVGDLDELSQLRDACGGADVSGCTAADLTRGAQLSSDLDAATVVSAVLYGTGAAAVLVGLILRLTEGGEESPRHAEARPTGPIASFDWGIGQWGFHVNW